MKVLPPPEIDRLQFYRIYRERSLHATCRVSAESKVVITGPPATEIYLDERALREHCSSGRVILKSIPTGQSISCE